MKYKIKKNNFKTSENKAIERLEGRREKAGFDVFLQKDLSHNAIVTKDNLTGQEDKDFQTLDRQNFKIFLEGKGKIKAGQTEAVITHNLGYVPAFFLFFKVNSGIAAIPTNWTAVPYFYNDGFGNPQVIAVSNDKTINVLAQFMSFVSNDMELYYYIFQQKV